MAMFFGLGSRGQKGTPVKFEFEILIEEIKPWAATAPVLLSWRRGSKRSGSTKSAMPVVGAGPDGGRIPFNEGFKLPATLFERKPGQFQKKCVFFSLLEDPAAKTIKIPVLLATGELDLALCSNLAAPMSTSIPLTVVALAGGPRGGGSTSTLYLTINPVGRGGSSLSLLTSSSSKDITSANRPLLADGSASRNSFSQLESDDDNDTAEIDSFTDDEDSPRSITEAAEATKSELNREKLFAPILRNPPKAGAAAAAANPFSVPPIKTLGSLAPKPSSLAQSSPATISSSDKIGFEALTETNGESAKLTEEEKRHKLLGLNLHAPPGKTFAAAAKSLEAAAASAGKTMEAARVTARKGVDSMRASAGKSVEAVAASAGKTVEAAATTGKSVGAASAAGKSAAAAAAAAYASKKAAAQTKDDMTSSSWSFSSLDLPSSESIVPAAAASDVSGSRTSASSSAGGQSPHTGTIARKLDSPGGLIPSAGPPAEVATLAVMPMTSNPPQQQAMPVVSWEPEKAAANVDKSRVPQLASADDQSEVGGRSVLGEARAKLAMVEKRAIEELRSKVAAAEAKAAANQDKGEERARVLEQKLMKLEDELRDSAAIEVALYSVVAEHASSSHKVHTPARRLARLYVHAYKNWSPERRASSARNSVLGLVLVVRACGNDVPRLTYWWSNMVVLRESIMQACNVEPTAAPSSSTDPDAASTSSNGNSFAARATRSQQLRKRLSRQDSSQLWSAKGLNDDWRECSTFVGALLRVESWIHGRILECVWWQAMTPPMQAGGSNPTAKRGLIFENMKEEINKLAVKVKDGLGELNKFAGDVKEFFTKERADGNLSQLGDARHGNISVEIWKNAFTDAHKRLCPLQGLEAECGCLPVLSRQIIAECVERLDVAMFNGIMRNPEDDSPTDPLADPITDLSVLPIPVGALTFGAGSQLKNAAVTWSTWLSALLSVKDPSPAETGNKEGTTTALQSEKTVEEGGAGSPMRFSILKATGDLLMLPKDMILDMAMRREVCPQLSLPLIRRILCNFVPDEFSPDPVSPALLAAINTEVSIERQRQGEAEMTLEDVSVAPVPPVVYTPPSSGFVRLWIGEPPGVDQWGKSTASLLRKGYTSEDELEEFQTPLAWLKDSPNTRHTSVASNDAAAGFPAEEAAAAADGSPPGVYAGRYQLLKEVWGAP